MKLDEEEKAMLAGEFGEVAQFEHQIAVDEFFGARDFVPVTQAHIRVDRR
jgi:predicted aconitase